MSLLCCVLSTLGATIAGAEKPDETKPGVLKGILGAIAERGVSPLMQIAKPCHTLVADLYLICIAVD